MHTFTRTRDEEDDGRSKATDKDKLRTAKPRYIDSNSATCFTVVKDEYWYVIVDVIDCVANVLIIVENADQCVKSCV
jgi:hypothetical protein